MISPMPFVESIMRLSAPAAISCFSIPIFTVAFLRLASSCAALAAASMVALASARRAGGLLVGLDVTGQMLPEFSIEFLGRAGTGERCTESWVVVGLSMGDNVYAKCLVIHLGHCDEQSAAGKKRHEFNEHATSFPSVPI
jgi:hypothetical protein